MVKVEHLSHRYHRDWAIRDINFEIGQKGVLGLLGSNGAGKSTTMNILCGVLNQTEGNVFIDHLNLRDHPGPAKKLLGFLPQAAPLHLDLTVDEYLTYCAYIRDIDKKKVSAAVDRAKAKCGIAHFSQRLIGNLSGGYRQRVGIAQAIIHEPRLVVLDEPTNGLDPNQILEVRQLIKDIAAERSVILSTHILSEVQATCHEIRMIEGGKMVFADTIDAFNNYINPNSMKVSMDRPPALEELEMIPGITRAERLYDHSIRMSFHGSDAIAKRIVELSVAGGWELKELLLEKSSLDEIFATLSHKTPSTYRLPAGDPRYTLLIPQEVISGSQLSQNSR